MTWIPTPSARFLLPALPLALCCLATSQARAADLTPQQVEDAVFSALTRAPLNFSGGQLNTVPFIYPSLSSDTLGEFLMHSSGWGMEYNPSNTLRSLLVSLDGSSSAILAALPSLSIDSNLLSRAASASEDSAYHLNGINSSLQFIRDSTDGIYSDVDFLLYLFFSSASSGDGYRTVNSHGDHALSVHDRDTHDLLSSIYGAIDSLDGSMSSVSSDLPGLIGTVTNAIISNSADLSSVEGYLESIDSAIYDLRMQVGSLEYDVENGGSVDPSGDDASDLPSPPQEGLSNLSPVDVDPSNLSVDLALPTGQTGNPVITLWTETRLDLSPSPSRSGSAFVTIPAGTIDLSGETMRRPVAVMGAISRTIWWLCFYLAVYFLIRREVVYYASLAHTEGS